MSDMRDSGSLECDADLICLLHRQEVFDCGDEELKGLADIIIAKQRNGPLGSIKLAFIGELLRFENLAKASKMATSLSV